MKTTISLNGKWKFTPTHDQHLRNNKQMVNGQPLYAHPALTRCDWENVPVPGVWQKYAEKYSIYEGVCWYFREFEIPELPDGIFANLVFKGVDYRADVYVNGQYAGWHESAYTEFSLDVSALVRGGRNCIAVQVDNRPLMVKWPTDWGYGVYGGIHRDVYLELYQGGFLYDIEVTPDYDVEKECGILTLRGRAGAEIPESVTVRLGESEQVISCDGKLFSARLEYPGVVAWSPESPALYDLRVEVEDSVCKACRIGFRHVECKQKKFLLNGRVFPMNGACYVYDSPRYGLVMATDQLLEDLREMKAANVNAIRTHYPMADAFYELCDEMGFLVWIEPNVYCTQPSLQEENTFFKQPDYVENAVNMTKEMIFSARQFASVVIYGIGNECNTRHPEALPFFTALADTIRAEDTTRLVGYASYYGKVGTIGHLVDIMGANSYFGWYGTISDFELEDKRPEENGMVPVREADVSQLHGMLEQMNQELGEDIPILLTEFGADSIPQYLSSARELWSENYHAHVVSRVIEESAKHPEVAGTFVFAFTDYLDPSKAKNGRWNDYNLKGMLTYQRERKLPFYALQKAYSVKK